MEIITIHIGTDESGRPSVGVNASSGVSPVAGVGACEAALGYFREQSIRAEVERRIKAEKEKAENGDD